MTNVPEIKSLIAQGDAAAAFARLVAALDPSQDFPGQHRLSRLFRSLPREPLGLKPLRLAILATSTVDHLAELLRLYLAREGFDAEIFLAEYDTVFQTALDPASALYDFRPEVVWVHTNHRDFNLEFDHAATAEDLEAAPGRAVRQLAAVWQAIQNNCGAHVIQNNADFPLERAFGNFDGRVAWSPTTLLRRFNLALAAEAPAGVSVFDLEHLSAQFGRQRWHDERYWFHSKHAFALDAVGTVAHAAARMVRALKGQARKCLVLDLDNTLWGGVIGDDGIEGVRLGQGSAEGEAFLAFQRYAKALQQRGIILAVCSKNEESIAVEAMRTHPEQVLRPDDFAVIVCNWSNKADNIRSIAATLDIGLDSLVFVDDNPAERAIVRAELPMVAVPELPDDPALYIRTLDQEAHFETVAFSEEDRKRGEMYRGNAQRKALQSQLSDLDGFLRDLAMEAAVGPFDALHLPRVAQLINKSNQFHLTTTRYAESQILAMLANPAYEGWWFKLADRFGDNGLISAVILRQDDDVVEVDTWVMSCRVLSRSMEDFIHNHLVEIARGRGARWLLGRYLPTRKNKLVENLYGKLGWDAAGTDGEASLWRLDLAEAPERKTYISRKG